MADLIVLKKIDIAGVIPTTSDLDIGVIGINTADGKMFIRKTLPSPTIVEVSGGGTSIIGGTITGDLTITGKLSATSKSFLIDHPTKPGYKLQYGSLESHENGVYTRGRITNNNTIHLPEYWTKLIDQNSITVHLTPIGSCSTPFVKNIVNNSVVIDTDFEDIDCFYIVYAERIDIDKLVVEIEK